MTVPYDASWRPLSKFLRIQFKAEAELNHNDVEMFCSGKCITLIKINLYCIAHSPSFHEKCVLILLPDKCDIKPISHVVTKEATKLFMLYARFMPMPDCSCCGVAA